VLVIDLYLFVLLLVIIC